MATNNITDKNILKSWFKRGFKPLETQFHAWMDSYWHKSEKIPTSSIDSLEETLNNKAEYTDMDVLKKGLENHTDDHTLHKTAKEQDKLDNLADNPNGTYAKKRELEILESNPDILIATVDFSLTEEEQDSNLIATLQGFYDKGILFRKPVYIHYRWKRDYESPEADWYECLVKGEYDPEVENHIIFSSPMKVGTTGGNRPKPIAYTLHAEVTNGMVNIQWEDYIDPVDESMIFLLYENGDNLITLGDLDMSGFYSTNHSWEEFYKAMKSGDKRIMLMLKTQDSMVYCPASYNFEWNEQENGFEGKMSIQYLKVINDVEYWCVDNYEFSPEHDGTFFKGLGSIYGDIIYTNDHYVHWIRRYPLRNESTIRLTIDLNQMDELYGIDSEAIENSLLAQAECITDWNKPIQLFLFSGNTNGGLTYEAILLSNTKLDNSKGSTFSLFFKTPDEFLDRIEEMLKLKIVVSKSGSVSAISITKDCFPDKRIFHLKENGDGVISLVDNQPHGDWDSFDEELKKGKHPTVYLSTPTSNGECPVVYNFQTNAEGKLEGIMEIHYYKMVEDERQLWIEKRVFTDGCSSGSLYSTEALIEKYSLEPDIIKFQIDLADTNDRDGLSSDTIIDSLHAQAMLVNNFDKKIELILSKKVNNTNYSYEAELLSKNVRKDPDRTKFTFRYKVPDELASELKELLVLTIKVNSSKEVSFDLSNEWMDDYEVFHLFENNDGLIITDNRERGDWALLDKKLRNGFKPVVYMTTPTSETKCLVTYKFNKDTQNSTFPGIMQISYIKEVNGQNQLWIEKRFFPDGCNYGSVYNLDTSEPEITKIPLPEPIQ